MSHSSTEQRLRGPRTKVNLGRAEWRACLRPGTRKEVGHQLRHGHGFIAGWPGKKKVLSENGELGSNSLGGDQQDHSDVGSPALHMKLLREMGNAFHCYHVTFFLLEDSLSPAFLHQPPVYSPTYKPIPPPPKCHCHCVASSAHISLGQLQQLLNTPLP